MYSSSGRAGAQPLMQGDEWSRPTKIAQDSGVGKALHCELPSEDVYVAPGQDAMFPPETGAHLACFGDV